jgi:long-chain acyl-CoA synthetase
MNIASWEADHVRRYGDHRGLVVGQREWTNIRLYDQACRLAAALIARGVEPGDRVALALPNDRELFVACSAAWLCGGVAVVLGEGPTTELAPLLGNCDPAVFIAADRRIADTVGKTVHRIAVGFTPASADVSSFDALIAAHEPIAEPVPRAEGDAAQLCYTSGATGRPKAAIYTHGGIEEFWRARALASGGAATNGVLLLAVPPTAFGARFIGMRVTADTRYVLLQRFDPERVLEAIERHRVTEIPLVPTMVEQLVACRLARPYDCSSLKTINISGSHVPAALVTRLRERVRALIPAAQRGRTGGQAADEAHELAVIVHYGMTETGGGFACTDAGGDGVVGPVSPSADVRIVAPNGEGLPRGEIGEIVVRTPYAAAGYWRDAEATAAVFRGGYVHTGDLGRFNGTDELCVLGRAKDLIIQAGQNIFPEEIARVIRALDGVAECAVIGLPDDLLGEVAVACVVLASGCGITERGIRSHCRRQLGPRKQPSRIVLVDALPKTRNGKVRSSQLKEAIITRTGRDRGTLALQLAANRTECVNLLRATIAAALRDVLADDADLSPVDSAATFGDLGVDSIGMVGIASLLGERLGRRLSATLLYSYPTIAALSEHLSRCWDDTGEVAASRPATRERVLSGTAPVAIVGIGCRLPGGVQGPDDFWQLLVDGRDAVRPAQLRGAIGTRRSFAWPPKLRRSIRVTGCFSK